MEWRKKAVNFGPLPSLLAIPFLLLIVPYNIVAFGLQVRRERRFQESMKRLGRTIDWAGFLHTLAERRGTLIVERFSFEGPIRMWWVQEDMKELCPYPLSDWFTMLRDERFDGPRNWFAERFTGTTGKALLVIGNSEQWNSIRVARPIGFRDDVRWIEVPPPRLR
jgi:hypothetical protein